MEDQICPICQGSGECQRLDDNAIETVVCDRCSGSGNLKYQFRKSTLLNEEMAIRAKEKAIQAFHSYGRTKC